MLILKTLLSPSLLASAAVVAGLVYVAGSPNPAPATRSAAAAPGPQAPPTKPKPVPKVRARAFLATDKLPAGRETTVAVVLDVMDGWHVRGEAPEEKYAIPTTVTVKTQRGTQIGSFAFPVKKSPIPGVKPKPLQELHGRVVLRAPVRVPASAAGGDETLDVTVKYQACDDAQCLRPKTLTFGGTLPVAAPGEPVRPANRE